MADSAQIFNQCVLRELYSFTFRVEILQELRNTVLKLSSSLLELLYSLGTYKKASVEHFYIIYIL